MSPASAYAPGRVELLGNHTDYNQGLVLAAAIDRGLTVAGISRRDQSIFFTSRTGRAGVEVSLNNLHPRLEERWANYPLGVVQQFVEEGYAIGGFDAEVSGDLPAGVGLSSSAAFEVATAGLLMKLHEIRMEPLAIAKLCQRAENDFVGVQSGLLDQVTAIFGKKDQLVYLDCQSEEIRTLPFPDGFALVIAESGVRHNLLRSLYNARRDECTAAAEFLEVESLRAATPEQLEAAQAAMDLTLFRRAAHIVGENQRVGRALEALQDGNVAALGALMNASHESSRTNFENSTPELDELVTIARSLPGVLGARLTGGGFGGGTVTLVHAAEAEEMVAVLQAKYAQTNGHQPAAFICRIADGAAAHWQK